MGVSLKSNIAILDLWKNRQFDFKNTIEKVKKNGQTKRGKWRLAISTR